MQQADEFSVGKKKVNEGTGNLNERKEVNQKKMKSTIKGT